MKKSRAAAQSPLERIKAWLAAYPNYDILGGLNVDYTDRSPCSSISPAGLVEVRRRKDIMGCTVVENQLNFALYAALNKAPGDNTGASFNADWLMDFQLWIQAQSIRGTAPTFGNHDTELEAITAQNGAIYQADSEIGVYFVQLSVNYQNIF